MFSQLPGVLRGGFQRLLITIPENGLLTKASWTAPQKHVSVVDIVVGT